LLIRLLELNDDLRGIKWKWQSLDSCICEGRFRRELTGSNPTDRGKLGTKRHVLTDQKGKGCRKNKFLVQWKVIRKVRKEIN
jgi:hypothetical protein